MQHARMEYAHGAFCLVSQLYVLRATVLHDCVDRWAADGFNERTGLFVERMDLNGTPQRDVSTRTMVQARQIFALCTAARLTSDPKHLVIVEQAIDRLQGSFLVDGGRLGCVYSVNPDGSICDALRHTYAHAFVVLALAEASRALGDTSLLTTADRLLAFVDSYLSAGQPGHYYADSSADGQKSRPQNPHMHLLESLPAADRGQSAGVVPLARQ